MNRSSSGTGSARDRRMSLALTSRFLPLLRLSTRATTTAVPLPGGRCCKEWEGMIGSLGWKGWFICTSIVFA